MDFLRGLRPLPIWMRRETLDWKRAQAPQKVHAPASVLVGAKSRYLFDHAKTHARFDAAVALVQLDLPVVGAAQRRHNRKAQTVAASL